MNLAEIKESFEFFDSWEDKYRFVIDLGRELPELSEEHKIPENLVRGCQSQVWLVMDFDESKRQFNLLMDSDAQNNPSSNCASSLPKSA